MKNLFYLALVVVLIGCCKAVLKPGQINIYGNETTSGDSLMSINFEDNDFGIAQDTTFLGLLSTETSISLSVLTGDSFILYIPGSTSEYKINFVEIDYRGRCAQKIKSLKYNLNGTQTESEIITISN